MLSGVGEGLIFLLFSNLKVGASARNTPIITIDILRVVLLVFGHREGVCGRLLAQEYRARGVAYTILRGGGGETVPFGREREAVRDRLLCLGVCAQGCQEQETRE